MMRWKYPEGNSSTKIVFLYLLGCNYILQYMLIPLKKVSSFLNSCPISPRDLEQN